MEKEKFLLNSLPPLSYRTSSSPAWLEVHGDMNSSSEHFPSSFLNLNWDNSVDHSMPFQSALSSIVSSPASGPAAGPADNIVIHELIGRLGSICNNSGDISPQSQTLGGTSYINSTSNSCYSTPLNSPPKLNLGMDQSRGNMPVLGNSLLNPQSLTQFAADPGFVERAAKFSCFGTRNYGGLASQFGFQESELAYRSMPLESGKLSRASSSHSLKGGAQASVLDSKEITTLSGPLNQDISETDLRSVSGSDKKLKRLSRSSTPNGSETEFSNNGREESSASDQIYGGELKGMNEVNARKRKAVPRGKTKDHPSSPSVKNAKAEDDGSKLKKCKPESMAIDKDEEKTKVEQTNGNSNAGDGKQMQTKDNPKPPEPPKQDYIHVRARRGQATDSHSLAERVRREKISERMKFLQDLVPGCNKVTGKAVMLDEIINYVQSLQRQVEFLSMKLATVNPRLDFEGLLSKDMLQSHGPPSQQMVYTLDSSASSFSYGLQAQPGSVPTGSETQCSVNPVELRRSLSMQLPAGDGYVDAASQLAAFWDDELQSVVQMGFGQNQEMVFSSTQSFHASLPTANMKLEL